MASPSSRQDRNKRREDPTHPSKVGTVYPPPANLPPGSHGGLTQASYETVQYRAAPLPSAQEMAAYQVIMPDAPERIMRMSEQNAEHRRWCDRYALRFEAWRSYIGQACGLTIALVFVSVAFRLGMAGHDWLAGALGTSTLVGLVTVFVIGRRADSKDDRADS